MGKLDIEVCDEWNFKFTLEEHDEAISATKQISCSYCYHTPLDKAYLYIINQLKEAGLLYEDYRPICCYCKVLTKFGLMDLRDRVSNFHYWEHEDILSIRFCFSTIKSHFTGELKWEYVNVRIHDWSKIKWEN